MNINELEGRELDVAVAEMMGFKKVGYYRRKYHFIVGWELCNKGDLDPFGNKARLYYYPDPGFLTTVPEYSRDITAAWLVEERIEELDLIDEYCIQLTQIVNSHWDEGADYHPFRWELIHATAEDRCRAALMAAEAEK